MPPETLVYIISFVTYSDWSNGEDGPGDVDVHDEDTDTFVVGCARTPEEAAVLVSRAVAARPPCDEENEDGPAPLDHVQVDAVQVGSPLGEKPVWSCVIQEVPAAEYQACLDEIRETIALHAAGG